MAVNFYVEQADRSPRSGLASEQIHHGTLVADTGTGVEQFSFSHGDYDGLALFDPEYLAAEVRDSAFVTEATADDFYEVDERVKYQPSEDAAIVKIRTLEDEGGPAPAIEHRSVVGVIDDADGDAPAGVVGRLVEEGYTADANSDGTSTTFDRASGNFLAIGRAYRPGKQNGETITDYDAPVRVVLFSEAKDA